MQGSRVQMVAANGVAQLTFSADFSVAPTPGPVVYVKTTNNPNTGQPLRIGAIKSTRGAQTYTFQLPPGVRCSWVIIWCDPFNVPMAEAAISPTPEIVRERTVRRAPSQVVVEAEARAVAAILRAASPGLPAPEITGDIADSSAL